MLLDIFESAENRQYFLDDTNLVWLHGTLLCKRLGYKNPSEAIQMHTEEDERQQVLIDGRSVWFVSEYGVWGLILASKVSQAMEFKRKLKREILPKLRNQGYYIARTDDATLAKAQAEINLLKQKVEFCMDAFWKQHIDQVLNHLVEHEIIDYQAMWGYVDPYLRKVGGMNRRKNTFRYVPLSDRPTEIPRLIEEALQPKKDYAFWFQSTLEKFRNFCEA